ncbi:unnamed protein product [Rhizoctonia solani]|uniref:Protein kinase domain-containing protein n=1 Tax=Rhizoctonia solani TaxID=456999 RepID=A0A8H3B6W0_9AGAM|nr:unnamed protein product [Rhizoctonia solani]
MDGDSITPECSLGPELLDRNIILSQLIVGGCEDATTQLEWPSVRHDPVPKEGLSRNFVSPDIYYGKLKSSQQLARLICFRTFVSSVETDLNKLKNVAHKISSWSNSKHPNILGMIGATIYQDQIAIVTPWTDYLDLRGFLLAHPQVDRYALSTRIAYGIAYLHGKNIVHGFIMGGTVHMMRDHTPKITGFCEATLTSSGLTTASDFRCISYGIRDSTARWMPPETLLDENDKKPEGDVYSLAMTILETMTGAAPYEGLWDGAAVLKIANGHHPQRPIVHMPYGDKKANTLWTLFRECWARDPHDRPTALEVLGRMTEIVSGSWMLASCQCTPSSGTQQGTEAHIASDTVIHRQMSVDEILSHLYEHGCKDATSFINQPEYSSYPVSYGGFGEVYKGRLKDGNQIALKCLRLALDTTEASQKQVRNAAHELYIWSKCKHPNILELIGVTQHRNQIAMVSPWMENGTLGWFLSKYPEADRYTLSAQITDGVAYLHGENIVHGDIKGTNVLVSKDCIPKITDFGTAALKDYTLKFTASATTSKPGMSLRWTAPEILEETTGTTFEGDIYALGMTILETMTGEVPYYETVNESALVLKIARQESPMRPAGKIPPKDAKADMLWSLLTSCWSYDPKNRPTATEVGKAMRNIAFMKVSGQTLDLTRVT